MMLKDEEMKQKAKAKGDPELGKSALDRDFVVVIKPNDEATYKNTVDILDEMTINHVKSYAMVKISETENELIKATRVKNKWNQVFYGKSPRKHLILNNLNNGSQ